VEEEENGDADEAEREDAGWWSCLRWTFTNLPALQDIGCSLQRIELLPGSM
jgi:hypothetical protein